MPIESLKTGNVIIDRIQELVGQGSKRTEDGNVLSGARTLEVTLSAGAWVTVAHKLGKKYTGYLLVKSDTELDFPMARASTDDSKYISLFSTAGGNVTLLVF